MNFRRILVPTDLSLNSRMGLRYAFSSAEQCRAEVVILHVASEWPVWQAMSDEMSFVDSNVYRWTVDKIVQEAVLDLNRFLEGHVEEIRRPNGALPRPFPMSASATPPLAGKATALYGGGARGLRSLGNDDTKENCS
jgi:hypothetical protein